MRAALIACVVLVGACHPPTPYLKAYSETASGRGTYLLRIRVTDDYGDDQVIQMAFRRAGELCPSGHTMPPIDDMEVDDEDGEKTLMLTINCTNPNDVPISSQPPAVQSGPPGSK